MKSETIIGILLVGLVLVGLFTWGYANRPSTVASVQGAGGSPAAKSALVAPETFSDFGTISMKNGDVTKEFTFTNPTDKDITIRGLETSCMCTTALLIEPDGRTKGPFGMAGMGGMTTTNETIKAGESRTLRVIYNPNAHGPAGIGQIDRFIIITDSSGNTLQFEIKALVTP